MLSIPHMIVVFIVVLVVFGPQKLPELARGLGKLMAEFRKASLDFRTAFEEEMRDLERQAVLADRKKAAEAAPSAVAAEPTAPPTPGTPTGAETSSNKSAEDNRAPEAPVTAVVPEAVPHSEKEAVEIKTEPASPSDAQESHHDAQHLV